MYIHSDRAKRHEGARPALNNIDQNGLAAIAPHTHTQTHTHVHIHIYTHV